VSDYKKLMDDIPNKAVNHLGLVVNVNLHKDADMHYIEIDVPVSSMPISYHGAYHYRSGSTKKELKGPALHEFLLRKVGKTWDDIVFMDSSVAEIEETAVASFIRAAIKSGRIYPDVNKDGVVDILENLELVTPEGKLKAAAILLFEKRPMKYFISSYFKIGKFGISDSDLRFQDTIEGNIFEMVDKVMRLLKERYLVSTISYEGIQRMEKLEYPEAALREAILNAIVHKDYTDSTIQLSVYDDKLILWNPGKLPDDLPIERLKLKHASRPRNKHIAETFFRAGYIESWGRGIDKILTACRDAGMPEPIFEEAWGGIQVTFLKDIYTEEYLKKLNLNERQLKAMIEVKRSGTITNKKYQELFKVSRNTASRDLTELVEKNVLRGSGDKGAGAFYSIK